MTKGALRGACIAVLVGIGLALPGIAKAAPPCGPKNILIVYSDSGTPDQLTADLAAQPGVASVDLFDARVGTPTLAQLEPLQPRRHLDELPLCRPERDGGRPRRL